MVERRRTATATGLYTHKICLLKAMSNRTAIRPNKQIEIGLNNGKVRLNLPYFFLSTQFLITFICVSKKFKRRGTRRQLNVGTGLLSLRSRTL